MNLGEKEFLKKYNIDYNEYKKTGLKWLDLMDIHKDFSKKKIEYEALGDDLLKIINKFTGVSSSRFRVKDSEHLIAKIIRKKIDKNEKIFNLNNYEQEIQDLIGFRVIHIFKEEWNEIDKEIRKRWVVEVCECNQRKGDDFLKNTGLDYAKMKIKEHVRGYRSIHYIVKTKEVRHKNKFIEIQVRTIFEEAWSEMDHKVIYPYHLKNKVLNNYSLILNRVAGMADEMGNFMKNEVVSLSKLDKLDDENKKLRDENELLKTKIREYENNLIDKNKDIKRILKENEYEKIIENYQKIINEPKKISLNNLQENIKNLYIPINEYKKLQEDIKKSSLNNLQENIKKLYTPINEYKKLQEDIKKSSLNNLQENIKNLYTPINEYKKLQEDINNLYTLINEYKKNKKK